MQIQEWNNWRVISEIDKMICQQKRSLLCIRSLCSWHTLIFYCVFFLAFLHVLYVSHKLNLLMLSSRLSYDQAWEEYNFLPFILFITGLPKCIARAVCGATHVTIVALFCGSSLLRSSNCVWAAEYEARQSVSANRNEESTGENCHWYMSVVNAITLYSCTIKLQYILLGDYWECVRPARLPILTRAPSSWEQHLRYVPHRVRNGYNTFFPFHFHL